MGRKADVEAGVPGFETGRRINGRAPSLEVGETDALLWHLQNNSLKFLIFARNPLSLLNAEYEVTLKYLSTYLGIVRNIRYLLTNYYVTAL